MPADIAIHWFRQDLRLADNAALSAAARGAHHVVPIYILDDEGPGTWSMGGASRWWLHHSLARLAEACRAKGSPLILKRGRPHDVLAGLARETGARLVTMTRAYEPWAVKSEELVKQALETGNVGVRRFSGALLFEPEDINTKSGDPFRVFSPFWRACLARDNPRRPLPAPQSFSAPAAKLQSDDLTDWHLLPTKPDWAGGLRETWTPGEAGGLQRLDDFVEAALAGYAAGRDRPDIERTSRLSPHLHFGEVSPHQCWHAVSAAAERHGVARRNADKFLAELGWREFSYHLLAQFPDMPDAPLRPEFAAYPWREDAGDLRKWQRGKTGYPIVDAGMRQLWQTGWMHNRVRMITASFLIKHLRLPWQQGEAWFWDTLVDADLASNAASWQWVAGSGADAAPYFRIFNPMIQGAKFDPNGDYVRAFVPELAKLPAQYIHAPWEAPPDVLSDARVELGKSYPLPIVEHAQARAAALAGYDVVKKQTAD